jgi:hypothetical protein
MKGQILNLFAGKRVAHGHSPVRFAFRFILISELLLIL